MLKIKRSRLFGFLIAAFAIGGMVFGAGSASATHSWNDYHWPTDGVTQVQLSLGDNLSRDWESDLAVTSSDWSVSSVLETTVVPGNTRPKNCKPTSGMVEVCNARYGRNGWLGLAQIWLSNGHIVQGVAKLNDTYFTMAAYNTPEKRLHVMCQEVGHTFGLGHTSEDGSSQNTCMDYSTDSTNSQHPNAHDYEQLELIYSHSDSAGTTGTASPGASGTDVDERSEWGRVVEEHGSHKVYVRNFGNGKSFVTFVTGVE